MNDSLRMRLGAVILALLTLAAVVFAVLNFQQRSSFVLPDDGVTWMDSAQGVTAWHVVADSPGAKAGRNDAEVIKVCEAVPEFGWPAEEAEAGIRVSLRADHARPRRGRKMELERSQSIGRIES